VIKLASVKTLFKDAIAIFCQEDTYKATAQTLKTLDELSLIQITEWHPKKEPPKDHNLYKVRIIVDVYVTAENEEQAKQVAQANALEAIADEGANAFESCEAIRDLSKVDPEWINAVPYALHNIENETTIRNRLKGNNPR
jgi:hypothetical protein